MQVFSASNPPPDLSGIMRSAGERTQRRTLEHRLQVANVVWDFALARDRIVYGGAAFRALVPPAETDTETDTDIEFYSPEPGRDVVELCELLGGMEFVQGREAVHPGTLTVSVGFRRCCDITFMPRLTLSMLPCLRRGTREVRCVHPHVMVIDLLRMMTEPDTSYWRLDKAYSRMLLLEGSFPLSWDTGAGADAADCPVIPELMQGCAVVVGAHAAGLFEGSDPPHGETSFQLVCCRYDHDVGVAQRLFRGPGHGPVRQVRLEAFGDLLGRSTRFEDIASGRCIVELIDAHPRCVPCSPSPGRAGSSLYCLVTAMACHLRAFVNNDLQVLAQQSLICTRLLASRARHSAEDFGLDHIIGATVCDMRLHQKASNHARRRAWMSYSPHSGSSEDRRRMWLASFPSRTGRAVLNGLTKSVQKG